MSAIKPPDTEIPCGVCRGTKKRQIPLRRVVDPKVTHATIPCGACLETGLSTFPWHQRRKWATIKGTPEEIAAREQTGFRIEDRRPVEEGRKVIALISWENPRYAEELAAAQAAMQEMGDRPSA